MQSLLRLVGGGVGQHAFDVCVDEAIDVTTAIRVELMGASLK